MRRIKAGVGIFADPLSLIFTLPVINDNNHATLHTHAGKFSKIPDDTQQQAQDEKMPVYRQLTMQVNSSERNFLLLQFGHRIPEKYLASIHNHAVIKDLEE
jgi:hypothetical protein